MKGQLFELESEMKKLKLEIEGQKLLIRSALPAYEDILKLKVKEAATAFEALIEKHEQYIELAQKAEALRGELYD